MTHTTESLIELRKLARDLIGFGNVCMNKLAQAGGVAIHELLDAITELVAERDTLRAQLDALQSGDELPEPEFWLYPLGAGFRMHHGKEAPDGVELCDAYYTVGHLRQAQAMARAKMLAELGKVEAVAWVRRHPDGSLTGEFLGYAVIESVRKKSGAWIPLYTRPLPAQDVNAELVEALENLVIEYEPNIKTFGFNAPRKAAWQAAIDALANAKAAQQKGQP